MKRSFFITYILFICAILSGLTFTIKNPKSSINEKNNYSQISDAQLSGLEGDPAIPLKTFFFEIPQNMEIKSIKLTPKNFREQILSKELTPNPLQQPLMEKSIKKLKMNKKAYSKEFPEQFLFNSGSGICGETKIGYISYYTAKYFHKKISFPEKFILNVELEKSRKIPANKANYASKELLKSLNLSQKTAPDTSGYLLIYPEKFTDNYLPLLYWRKQQGLKVYTKTVEEIDENYSGNDLQEKIRNCIIDENNKNDIAFVTLGADVDDIPNRNFFAFDCQYGAYPDENNLPADMYYSCLDGNWDANQNGIFGEDSDEPDYFPDVFVSRITAKNQFEVSHYISRLITYEKGDFDNYETAGGFSMDLWPGSNSILSQEYIYQHYFPENYDINILSGDEATIENAINLLDTNKNIIQHTGHANWQVLALESDYFYKSDCNQISNNFSGLFYSIGCWSSALDYDSIAESMLINDNGGFEGYIGNSRYGWGSPSSPGFGFSEFYQKEFFKNLFKNDITLLAEGNAMQKVHFIPYFSGVSIYKWCAYELNAIGDSYARIITKNPKNLNYTFETKSHQLLINLTGDDGLPISNVVANLNNQNYFSNENGLIEIDYPVNGSLNLYKNGYKNVLLDYTGGNSTHGFFSATDSLLFKKEYYQGENIKFNLHLSNNSDINYDCVLQYLYDNNFIDYDNNPINFHLSPNSYFTIKDSLLRVKTVPESSQILPRTNIPIKIILKTLNGEILDSIIIPVIIKSPAINIIATNIDTLANKIYFSFQVKNTGNAEIDELNLKLFSQEISFSEDEFNFAHQIIPGRVLDFETEIIPEFRDATKLINYHSTATVKSNNYQFENILPISNKPYEFFDDFEKENKWSFDENWKRVNTYSVSGDSSLSCRLDSTQTGTYAISSPILTYLPDSRISFDYKYKVFMYGYDSIIFQITHSEITDTLICLGSGGALNQSGDHNTQSYIHSDWANYDFNINDVVNHPLFIGEQFTINLQFSKGSTADYLSEENGIFLDDIKYYKVSSNEKPFNDFGLKLYPNPALNSINVKFLNEKNSKAKLDVFNIKGQKVDEIEFEPNNNKFGKLNWKLNNFASGVYIFRLNNGKNILYKKAVILK